MKRTLTATIAALAVVLVIPLAGQLPQVFPAIDVWVPVPPRPLVAGGITHLVYELHITNLSPRRTTIDAVEVRDRSAALAAPPLLRLDHATLEAALQRPGALPDAPEKRVLPGGRAAILFVWLTMPAGVAPTALTHRFAVDVASPEGVTSSEQRPGTSTSEGYALTVTGVDVPVSAKKATVIGPPLEGDLWLAANGPDNGVGHRRALIALAGEARLPQRFAIDWVRLFEDGRTYRGDPRDNASYRAFGARVLAVADGTVVETMDGIPENVPDPVARAVSITPTTLGGNYVLLDLGDKTSAVYAHLQPGSLRVKKGERVHRGQVLGLVGNTGNSSEPHLHFHVADRPSAFDAEGVPYAFESFELEAAPDDVTPALFAVGDSLGIDPASLARWKAKSAPRREFEMPLLNAIVKFQARRHRTRDE